MEQFIRPVEILQEKRRYHLFPVFNEKTEIFCTICLDQLVSGFMLRQSEQFSGILQMVQLNPVPVFSAKNNTSTI